VYRPSTRRTTLNQEVALDRFLSAVEVKAFRMARIATGNEDDALEIVQETMLTLVQRYGTRSEQEWGPLFHRILQNRIRDWYRRSKVRNRFRVWFNRDTDEDDPLENRPDPAAEEPLQQLEKERFGAALEKAISELPNRQQQAFLLRAWEGMSVEEAAAAMGISGGSVKTHYSRAVHTLREQLEEMQA
jgi:RNA polymerase sigma-70 factor, ECF subfamily